MRISDWSSDVCSSELSASLAAAIVEADPRGLPLLDALYTVAEQLNEACGPLQEAGRRTIEGEELGSLLQFAVFNPMEICAAKSDEVAYYVRLARFLADTYGFETRQAFIAGDEGRDPEIWTALARDLGMLGASFAEAHGGLGGGALENAIVTDELGKVLAGGPS